MAGKLRQDSVHRAVMAARPATMRDGLNGLILKISPRGAAWHFEYRPRGIGPKRRGTKLMNMADYTPEFRLDAARRAATENQLLVDAGRDPLAEQQQARAANLSIADGMTVADLIEKYSATKVNWRRQTRQTGSQVFKVIDQYVGGMPLRRVTHKILNDLLANFMAGQTARGYRGTLTIDIVSILQRMFDLALDQEWVETNPAARLRVPEAARRNPRERVLNVTEILQVWAMMEKRFDVSTPAAVALISLVTGARIGAVVLAEAGELDLEGSLAHDSDGGPVWRIPGIEGRKIAETQVVPLAPLAVTLLRRVLGNPNRPAGITTLFSSNARDPRSIVSMRWVMWREAGKVPPGTTPHDLRRTARTWWGNLAQSHGQSSDTMERLLGHKIGSAVFRTYDQAMYLPQQRIVANAWGLWLTDLLDAPDEQRIVPLRRSQS